VKVWGAWANKQEPVSIKMNNKSALLKVITDRLIIPDQLIENQDKG
jgi:hypothetical protein